MTDPLPPTPVVEFKTAESFETWLAKNHDQCSGIWLKIFKKASGTATVSYAEALDVALCYGWIDGQKKAFDDQAWLQKFCPRREKSIWSKINIGHAERLIHLGRMKTPGLKAIENAKSNENWENAYDSSSTMTIPEDFLDEVRRNKKARASFENLSKTDLYSIGFRLQTAKKQETREKRIKQIVEMLAKGEKFS